MNASLLFIATFLTQTAEPVLFFRASGDGKQVVARLPENAKVMLPKGRLTQEQGETLLVVSLVDEVTKKSGPAMLGKYERDGNALTFTPRFPFEPRHSYRATFRVGGAAGMGKTVTREYHVPPPPPRSPPRVVKIYPTADVLPANQLRFYIYFDRPMRGGKEIFKQVVLVDDKGKVIDDPWLLDEIWDDENNCLIIYIQPGRIKWGVLLRELLGPVFVEKRRYALVIRGTMRDPQDNQIGMDVVKKFRTTSEDRVRIDLSRWKLSAPKAGSMEALALDLPKSLDHRGLQSNLKVFDARGTRVDGKIAIGTDEKSWRFTPNHPWRKGAYHLRVDGRLEDVAGNTPLRPFDLDLKAKKLPPQKLRLEFQVP
ncbi:MAG: hypothetical protein HYX68_12505 [Planctomycetes bacterium]|nr:hypothetical protein [Planctomycetota bacterium]